MTNKTPLSKLWPEIYAKRDERIEDTWKTNDDKMTDFRKIVIKLYHLSLWLGFMIGAAVIT
jgi:hypothetical protein